MPGVGGGMMEMFHVFYRKLLEFLPNFVTALILLLVGIGLAKILGLVFLRVFRAVNVDGFWDRAGIREVLVRGGIKRPPSVELSRTIYWLTVLIFMVIALNALQIPVIEAVLARFFLYLPNVFLAILILFTGYVLSSFFGRAVLIALVNSGVQEAGLIARAVRFAIFVFAVTMALEQLDIGKLSVLIAFTILFGGIVLAFAIAFGLGGQHYVKAYLERRMKEKGEREEEDHIDHV